MGITNNIPPSRLIQPGVIDNTAARPASPFEGQCIFQKDTDQLLVWNGSAWVIPNSTTQNPDGLELITSGTLSGTATNFEGCFTSTYTNYRIVVNSISLSGTADINCRYLIGSTPTTTVTYRFAHLGVNSAGTSFNLNNDGSDYIHTGITISGITDSIGSLTMDVIAPQLAVRTFSHISAASFTGGYLTRNGIGVNGSVSQFDGIRLYTGTAVTMTGTVTIYGYRK